jgi:hypothetical protein
MANQRLIRSELNRLKFILKGAAIDATKGLLYRRRKFDEDIPVKTSMLGTEVFTNLSFKAGSFIPLGGGEPIPYEKQTIDTVLMTVTQVKNIIRTPIQGKSGTIKEYVADGDFEIDVSGIIVSEGENTYPTDEVESLMQLFSIPDSLRITCEFLNHFGVASPKGISGIDEVVITDFSFPQTEGMRNSQVFSCKMISDTPIELII